MLNYTDNIVLKPKMDWKRHWSFEFVKEHGISLKRFSSCMTGVKAFDNRRLKPFSSDHFKFKAVALNTDLPCLVTFATVVFGTY